MVIVQILGAITFIAGACIQLDLLYSLPTLPPSPYKDYSMSNYSLFVAIAIYYICYGAFFLFVAYSLAGGKGSSWTLTVLAQTIVIPVSLLFAYYLALGQNNSVTAMVLGIIFAIIVLPYMFRSTTRAYFNKARLTP
jgi:Na+-driven multidrug efflux pump